MIFIDILSDFGRSYFDLNFFLLSVKAKAYVRFKFTRTDFYAFILPKAIFARYAEINLSFHPFVI